MTIIAKEVALGIESFGDNDAPLVLLLGGALSTQMALWCRGEGAPPYPLADGCQDHLLGLAIGESARTGAPVTTTTEAWAN